MLDLDRLLATFLVLSMLAAWVVEFSFFFKGFSWHVLMLLLAGTQYLSL